jgi:hypothetical protein
MEQHSATLGSHQVAAKKTEIRLRVFFFYLSHKVRSVKVARSLARYKEIFHFFRN